MVPHVLSLTRYPVKSMLGEQVPRIEVDARGCAGDRRWSIRTRDDKIGSGKSTRRFAAVPGLLDLRARIVDGAVAVTLPDGTSYDVADPVAAVRVSEHVGEPVTFARESDVSHFDDGPVSVLGSASVAALSAARGVDVDPARFRANVLLETAAPLLEDGWIGTSLSIGTAVLGVEMTSPRCVMVDMKTADLPAQHGNLLAVGRLNGACLGVVARVVEPGVVSVGDEVTVLREAGR